jgi:hypothetical protein
MKPSPVQSDKSMTNSQPFPLSAQQEQNEDLENSFFAKLLGLQEVDLSRQPPAPPAAGLIPAD